MQRSQKSFLTLSGGVVVAVAVAGYDCNRMPAPELCPPDGLVEENKALAALARSIARFLKKI